MNDNDFRYEDLNGEIVVLDTSAGVVHRITGESAAAVRAETDPVSRRTLVRAAVALGVAAGVTSLHLPAAAAAASGTGGGGGTSSTIETVPVVAINSFTRSTETFIFTAHFHTASWSPVPEKTEYEYYRWLGGEWVLLSTAELAANVDFFKQQVAGPLSAGKFRLRRISASGAKSEWTEAILAPEA